MDHKGIDLRSETAPVRAVFDAAPEAARAHGWRHVPQGGEGTPVYCCHTEVKGKHWVYPPIGDATQTRPIEIAFGELEIHGTKMGCDLRPIDPAHPRAAEARAALSACASAHATEDSPNGAAANGTRGSSYYERGDLRRFADVGPGPASVANVLREAGLISGERRGTWIYCRAHSEVLARLQALLVPDETARPVGEADPGVLAYEAASAVGTHQGIGAHLFLPIHVLQGRDDPSTRLGNETGVTSARPKP